VTRAATKAVGRAAVGIFAKVPRPGRVKTRLVPPLTSEEAALVARVCLEETLRRFPAAVPAAWFLFLDGDAGPWIERHAIESGVTLAPQGNGDLGERLARAFRALRGAGFERVVMIGADSPTLDPERIRDAVERLTTADVVLGPTRDGGYYLVGARVDCGELFRGMTWGHGGVAAATRERARSMGWEAALLPEWYDLDEVDDLRRSARDAAASSPALAALLASLGERLSVPSQATGADGR